ESTRAGRTSRARWTPSSAPPPSPKSCSHCTNPLLLLRGPHPMRISNRPLMLGALSAAVLTGLLYACRSVGPGGVAAGDAATKVYVPPGQYDEYYAFLSGGFNGQIMAYGLPSGRLLKIIPVFSQNPETGYGYNEESKPMFETSHG